MMNFANDDAIFLCDKNYITRLQHILKLYKKASKPKVNFSRILMLRAVEPRKMVWFQFSSKISKFYFGNSNLHNKSWDKVNDNT